jgi:hypothetical protein
MVKETIPQEVLKYLQKLPPDKQQEVLEFARSMMKEAIPDSSLRSE